MLPETIIVDSDFNLLAYWKEVFHGVSEVNFINSDLRYLANLANVDAILMRWVIAHERYGGIPRKGEAQVLNSNQDPVIPKLIVTTPMFQYGDMPKSEVWDYEEWVRIFTAVDSFNSSDSGQKINTLGFELSSLYGFRKSKPYDEAHEVKRAFLEYRKASKD